MPEPSPSRSLGGALRQAGQQQAGSLASTARLIAMLQDLASGAEVDVSVYEFALRRASFGVLAQEIGSGGRQAELRALPILEAAALIYNSRALAAMATFLEGFAALEPGALAVAATDPAPAAAAPARQDDASSMAALCDFEAAVRLARRLGLLADGALPSIQTSGPSLFGYHLRDASSRTLARLNRQTLN
ncbi:MAG: hypothetical protein VKM92_01960, partial [Cyanobacteriota bacterium]|nr:hypothetical protein [Cyanobacteriota bacterium]